MVTYWNLKEKGGQIILMEKKFLNYYSHLVNLFLIIARSNWKKKLYFDGKGKIKAIGRILS